MTSRIKSTDQTQTAWVRRTLVILFVLSLGQMALAPVMTYYLLRDNNGPPLTPNADYRVNWITDDDFRGLDAEKGAVYAAPAGNKTYAAGETWQRFRPFSTATPDGRWHFQILARGPLIPYSFQAYMLAAIPSAVFSVFGLMVCLYGWKADSSWKAKDVDPTFQDLT